MSENLTLEQIKDKLQDRIISMVSEHTGLSSGVLYKLKSGEPGNYSRLTIKTISKYLRGE